MKLSLHAVGGTGVAVALLLALSPASPQPAAQQKAPVRSSPAPVSSTCADGVVDEFDPSNCIAASSRPGLGKLYPMSEDLFVHPNTRRVGIGTTFPFADLEVVGSIAAATDGAIRQVVLRPSSNQEFGVMETISYTSGPFPWVTNLFSTVSIDPASGALATLRQNEFLTALTTSAGDSRSGYVSVYSSNNEVAGIDGSTGTVFGATKAFVQPHPEDPTLEIQYVSLEGPEHGVYFRGSARLVDGVASIPVPESFRLVAREAGLTVSLTPLGPNRGLWVERKGLQGILVRENDGGAGDVSFDFLVMGERSAMPPHVAVQENTHFAPRPGTTVPEGRLPGAYRDLMIRNGTLNADGGVNAVSATRLGWREEGGAWTGGRSASAELAERRDPR